MSWDMPATVMGWLESAIRRPRLVPHPSVVCIYMVGGLGRGGDRAPPHYERLYSKGHPPLARVYVPS